MFLTVSRALSRIHHTIKFILKKDGISQENFVNGYRQRLHTALL